MKRFDPVKFYKKTESIVETFKQTVNYILQSATCDRLLFATIDDYLIEITSNIRTKHFGLVYGYEITGDEQEHLVVSFEINNRDGTGVLLTYYPTEQNTITAAMLFEIFLMYDSIKFAYSLQHEQTSCIDILGAADGTEEQQLKQFLDQNFKSIREQMIQAIIQ